MITMKNLRAVMKLKKIGCTELARRMTEACEKRGLTGVARMGVWHWVRGHSIPPGDKIYILAAILKVHPRKIMQLEFDPEKIINYKNL